MAMIAIKTVNRGIVLASAEQLMIESGKALTLQAKRYFARLARDARRPAIVDKPNDAEYMEMLIEADKIANMSPDDRAAALYVNCAGQDLGTQYKEGKKHTVSVESLSGNTDSAKAYGKF